MCSFLVENGIPVLFPFSGFCLKAAFKSYSLALAAKIIVYEAAKD